MKGDNFSPKEKHSYPAKKDSDIDFKKKVAAAATPKGDAAAPVSDIGRSKRKIKPRRDFSSTEAEQVSSSPKVEHSRLKFDSSDNSPAPENTSRQKQKKKLLHEFSDTKPVETLDITSKDTSSFQLDARDGVTPPLTEKQVAKLDKMSSKLEKSEKVYLHREEKLPTKKKLKLAQSPAGKRSLQFETQTKAEKETLESTKVSGKVLKRSSFIVAKATVSGAVDGSGEQSDDEKSLRTGVEKTVSIGAEAIKDTALAPVQFHSWRNDRKYRKFQQAEEKAVQAGGKRDYQKFRLESTARHKADPQHNPKPASNPFSRALQKRRFIKDYQKSLKDRSREVGRSFGQSIKRLVNGFTKHLKKIGLVVLAIILVMVSIGSCMQGIGLFSTGIFKGIFSTTYPADDKELSDADWYFSDLEAGLVGQIEQAEQLYSGYDEYNYFLNGAASDKQSLISAIGHDPFAFLSFISVMHEDFKFREIQGDLQEFFSVVFQLELETVTETRYRTVDNGDGTTSEESYTYYILNTKLTVSDWETVVQPYIDSKDGQRQYDEYINSGGNHQMFGTPFNFDWYGSISCHYGGRDNPTGANTGSTTADGKEMHTGLDIKAPLGTPIYSIMEGTVTFSGWHDLYGNYVDITHKNGNKSRYAHCSKLLVSVGQEVKEGQAIAEVGSTGNSTGNHLHLEIFLNGNRVNPLFLIKQKPSESEG